jgi:hypothetical protein
VQRAFERADVALFADKRSGGRARRCLSQGVREFAERLVCRAPFDRRDETLAEQDT